MLKSITDRRILVTFAVTTLRSNQTNQAKGSKACALTEKRLLSVALLSFLQYAAKPFAYQE